MNVNLGWLGTVLVLIVATVCIVVLHQHGVF